MKTHNIRRLCIVLGDQLNFDSALFDEFDPKQDAIWMAELAEEQRHVKSHKQRIVLFLSAMRHFAEQCHEYGFCLHYLKLGKHQFQNFEQALSDFLAQHRVESVEVVVPGDYRVLQQIKSACENQGQVLKVQADRHFISLPGEFKNWMTARKQPRMEYWYRHLRQRTGVLMKNAKPVGGKWNFDASNREAFDSTGPQSIVAPLRFEPDAVTRQVMDWVVENYTDHPGKLESFGWPVTRTQALQALGDFINNRLENFGRYQDAMWPNQIWLFHSLVSSSLNLKLLNPQEVIEAAEQAYQQNKAPIESVEGFIRQILGWREYVRGLYWHYMPDWKTWNALQAEQPLPKFYWNGETDMVCLRDSLQQVLRYGYGHHIQRLMVTGLFALLWQVRPKDVHEWYLAMYVDAVEWVELPNVLGMSQFADGGLMASKPYIASGQYIDKMSGYCQHCRFKPKLAVGDEACPFTTLYWDFISSHYARFTGHPRLGMQVRHWNNMSDEKQKSIKHKAKQLRIDFC